MSIAFDDATDGGIGSVTLDFTHTCAGADRMLLLAIVGDYFVFADDLVAVTYDDEQMVLAGKHGTASTRWIYLYYMFGPATGANDVEILANSAHFLGALAASYTGVAQQAPEVVATGNATTDMSLTLTTLTDNAWTMAAAVCEGATISAGTGSTSRVEDGTYDISGLFDSNAGISPAASTTMHILSAGAMSGVIAAFAPVSAPPAGQPTMKRWGGVPHVGGRKSFGRSGSGGAWGRTREGLHVPQRFAA